ncbi:MAG: GNAT family N-acetyltransferase [Pseudomonadota bacterium]
MTNLHCTELTAERSADYLKFFDSRAFSDNPRWSGCYCYFPLHDPAKTDWHQRSAVENRSAISTCLATGQARGYLAYAEGEVVGWCNAGPWAQFPMLSEDPEPDAATLGVVFCFVVAPEARGQGVAAALLEAACEGLRRQGMTAVQAKPLKAAEGAAANHLGPISLYLKAGFQVVRETDEGDVFVRKALVA